MCVYGLFGGFGFGFLCWDVTLFCFALGWFTLFCLGWVLGFVLVGVLGGLGVVCLCLYLFLILGRFGGFGFVFWLFSFVSGVVFFWCFDVVCSCRLGFAFDWVWVFWWVWLFPFVILSCWVRCGVGLVLLAYFGCFFLFVLLVGVWCLYFVDLGIFAGLCTSGLFVSLGRGA